MMEKLEKASSSSSPTNLSELLRTLTNDVITRVVLGKKYSSEEGGNNSKNIVRRLIELLGVFPLGEYIPSLAWIDRIRGFDKNLEEVNKEIDGFMEKVVEEHIDAKENTSDFVDTLLSIQRDKTTSFELDRNGLKNLLKVKQSPIVFSFFLLTYFLRKIKKNCHHVEKINVRNMIFY